MHVRMYMTCNGAGDKNPVSSKCLKGLRLKAFQEEGSIKPIEQRRRESVQESIRFCLGGDFFSYRSEDQALDAQSPSRADWRGHS